MSSSLAATGDGGGALRLTTRAIAGVVLAGVRVFNLLLQKRSVEPA